MAFYVDMLHRWNKSINLVGASGKNEIAEKLLPDSFALARFLDALPLPPFPHLWDAGAGAGLPGIPLRIVWSRGSYAMIEARQKRALFLANVLASLRLPETSVFRGAYEDYSQDRIKAGALADCIVSRAFRPWRELPALFRPALKPEGIVLIMANGAPSALPEGWELAASGHYRAAGMERWLWAIRAKLARRPAPQ